MLVTARSPHIGHADVGHLFENEVRPEGFELSRPAARPTTDCYPQTVVGVTRILDCYSNETARHQFLRIIMLNFRGGNVRYRLSHLQLGDPDF